MLWLPISSAFSFDCTSRQLCAVVEFGKLQIQGNVGSRQSCQYGQILRVSIPLTEPMRIRHIRDIQTFERK